MPKTLKAILFPAIFVLFLGQSAFAADPVAGPIVGQIISKTVDIDGVRVPSGSTLISKSLLKTDSYPAVIHLAGGQIVELSRNSSAYFETTPSRQVRVIVRSGVLSFRGQQGEVAKAAPGSEVVLSSDQGRAVTPLVKGVVATLLEEAVKGQKTLKVNDATKVDPKQTFLITDQSRKTQEAHYVASIVDETSIKMTAALNNSFKPHALIIQGSEVPKAVAAAAARAPLSRTGAKVGSGLLALAGGAGTAKLAGCNGGKDNTQVASPTTP